MKWRLSMEGEAVLHNGRAVMSLLKIALAVRKLRKELAGPQAKKWGINVIEDVQVTEFQ